MRIHVVMTAHARLDLLDQTLASWANVEGVHGTPFTIYADLIEDIPEEEAEWTQQQIRQATERHLPTAVVHPRDENLGNAANTFLAISDAFTAGADFVIVAEDDILVGTDVLDFFQYAARAYQEGGPLALLAHSGRVVPSYGDAGTIEGTINFSPLVWGTWRGKWMAHIMPTWDFGYTTGEGDQKGWDWNISRVGNEVTDSSIFPFLRPHVSRSQHIGETGLHCTPELQKAIFLPDWTPDFPKGLWPATLPEEDARDDLAKLIYTADDFPLPGDDQEQRWERAKEQWGDRLRAYTIADALIKAGYRNHSEEI